MPGETRAEAQAVFIRYKDFRSIRAAERSNRLTLHITMQNPASGCPSVDAGNVLHGRLGLKPHAGGRWSTISLPALGFVMASRPPKPFSWIRTRRLAIGGFPQRPSHWEALQAAGIRRVFSCCDPGEAPWQPPADWRAEQMALPDHRHSDPPSPALLGDALERLERLHNGGEALYLHCWAGMERSPLLAVGLLCRCEGLAFFEALAQVRALHPAARPITSHLLVLEQILINPA